MIRSCLLLLLFSTTALFLHAQPDPCGEPPAMTSTCAPACVICDIDGFTGINNSTIQGQAPPGFCTTVVHHMQWIAFIAGSTNLTLSVEVFNCQDGPGLEIGIYQGINCQNFQLVSNCNTDVQNNTTAVFTNTVPLVVGQYYYFVMDGNQGDICNYTIHVLEGSTAVDPLFSSGDIQGPFETCPGQKSYTATGVTGATEFNWMVDGATVAQGPNATINWSAPGTYELCVQASNACDVAPATCQTVTVTAIPPQQISASLCAGECLDVADTTLCDPGDYTFHFITAAGCDSVIQVNLNYNQTFITNLDLHICDGDTLFVAGQPFFQTGQYQQAFSTVQGCDSLINLDLTVVLCQIAGSLTADDAVCHGESSGQIHFSVANGTPPFNYLWERVGASGPSGQGSLAALNTTETIAQLPAGDYLITVSDNYGNQLILIGSVGSPPPLSNALSLSEYNGYGVSCADADDGSVTVMAGGGVAPYSYLWSNGATQANLNQLPAGVYTLTLTDAQACSLVQTATLSAPAPLVMNAGFNNPSCEGPGTGSIMAGVVSGGTTPYEYDLSGAGFGPENRFDGLFPGAYTLTVRDASGCTLSQTGALTAPVIPVVSAGNDAEINLGEEVLLDGYVNIAPANIIWSPPGGLSCTDCTDPLARPSETTTYILAAISPDGCLRSDTVTVRVDKVRNVYIPNAFSPNDDGDNDRLVVSCGVAVEQITLFRVYSRWGELVYEGYDLSPDDQHAGWDGQFHGKTVDPGVFTWVVEVAYLDGVKEAFTGTATVLP
ncbi:MAG: gliding motility-associated C-terminal domain-containing protein [Saprospiraceae bacterium]|nr:gliding motility-associated C-terminal domain-containing protein [Saprospiraceae bacterium]